MDAFVTRAPSVGPSRTRDSGAPSKRLPASHAIPSFFGANKVNENVGSNSLKTSHVESSDGGHRRDKGKGRASTEVPPHVPHARHSPLSKRAQSVPAAHSSKLKQTVINITKSLKSADNPVTHSSSFSGAFHYVSCSSGHQTNNGKSREGMKSHTLSRNAKLKAQGAEAQTGVFKGVRAYINGTTMPLISNLDLIRLIQENGGDVKYAFSKTGCTHIICVHGLSSQKTHKELNGRSRTKVVTPDWVLDSISEGKKLAEYRYRILSSETQSSIRTAFSDKAAFATHLGTKGGEDDDIKLLSLSQIASSSPAASCMAAPLGPEPVEIDDDGLVNSEVPIIISSSQ